MGIQCARESGRFRAFVALDGVPWLPKFDAAVFPLHAEILDVAPWPVSSGPDGPGKELDRLARIYSARPVLGLTARSLRDHAGYPQRGASLLGGGVALVSAADLDDGTLAGVIRHELAHALGMAHCPDPACVLSERPWPLAAEDRPAEFCPPCARRWRLAVTGGDA